MVVQIAGFLQSTLENSTKFPAPSFGLGPVLDITGIWEVKQQVTASAVASICANSVLKKWLPGQF